MVIIPPIFEKDTIFQTYYQIRVNDPYKFANNQKYVQVSEVGGTEMMVVTEGAENGSVFTLKRSELRRRNSLLCIADRRQESRCD